MQCLFVTSKDVVILPWDTIFHKVVCEFNDSSLVVLLPTLHIVIHHGFHRNEWELYITKQRTPFSGQHTFLRE